MNEEVWLSTLSVQVIISNYTGSLLQERHLRLRLVRFTLTHCLPSRVMTPHSFLQLGAKSYTTI